MLPHQRRQLMRRRRKSLPLEGQRPRQRHRCAVPANAARRLRRCDRDCAASPLVKHELLWFDLRRPCPRQRWLAGPTGTCRVGWRPCVAQ